MSGFEMKIIQQIINKLGCQNDPSLIEKTTELVRLLELKSSKVVSSIGDYGKTVICVDLAAAQLGIVIDMDHLLKISGSRKSVYMNNKRIIEKLLDLSEPLSIIEICTQLNVNELAKKSLELFELFKNHMKQENFDLQHSQYKVMAVWQANKLLKKKIQKTTMRNLANLKQAQWNKLEEQWDKIIAKSSLKQQEIDKNTKTANDHEKLESAKSESTDKSKPEDDEIEDYEIWKTRMITFAKLELGLLTTGLED